MVPAQLMHVGAFRAVEVVITGPVNRPGVRSDAPMYDTGKVRAYRVPERTSLRRLSSSTLPISLSANPKDAASITPEHGE